MIWPVVAIAAIAVGLLLCLHLWWKQQLARTQRQLRAEMDQLAVGQQQQTARIQAQHDALLNSMVEGLLVLDGSGRIQLANRAFTSFFSISDDIRGKTILEALRSHELAELAQRLPDPGHALQHELRLSGPAERWFEVNAAAIPARNGGPPGAILVFHDLTRTRKLERTREEFVANVSHELRTPLSLIKGYAETLLDGAKDNPDVATKFLQTIDRNAERLKLLIEDLLTISALESGKVRLELRSISLPWLVDKIFADFRSRAAAKKVELLNTTPPVKVHADMNRLEQVLCNLVDNAIKYGRTEGTVTVSARSIDPEHVEISVHDNGPGIPPEALDRVFERFFRVDKARSRDQGGTGLGLAIVKHIVQSHGGRVWAESTLGQGTTFFFTLPMERQPELVL